jgi:hypothetical protein
MGNDGETTSNERSKSKGGGHLTHKCTDHSIASKRVPTALPHTFRLVKPLKLTSKTSNCHHRKRDPVNKPKVLWPTVWFLLCMYLVYALFFCRC